MKVVFTGNATGPTALVAGPHEEPGLSDITLGKEYKVYWDDEGDPFVVDDNGEENYAVDGERGGVIGTFYIVRNQKKASE